MAEADTVYTYTGDYFGTAVFTLGQTWPSVSGVYTTADRITGSFTVADGFVPGMRQGGRVFAGVGYLPAADGGWSAAPGPMDGVLAYSFSDGHQTLTKANSTGEFYLTVGTLSLTTPDAEPMWNISIQTPGAVGGIFSYYFLERHDIGRLDADNWGKNGNCLYGGCDGSHLGTWSVTVPEPMSIVLVIAGIGGLVGARRFHRI